MSSKSKVQSPKPGAGASANLDAIIASLRATPVTVLIDEAHDGGIVLMKLIRALIDATPSRFVYLIAEAKFVADEDGVELDGALIIKHVEDLVGKAPTQKKEAKP